MTERGLRVSEISGWELDSLETDAASLGRLVENLDGALLSMQTEHDAVTASWDGPGSNAAADRVAKDKTAGSHVAGKIADIKDALYSGHTQLRDAKNFVLGKRTTFLDMGFEVDDRGIVSATEKVRELNRAGGERGDVMAAGLAVMAEAGRHTLEMLEALQHAKGVADGVQTHLRTLNSELSTLMVQEAPSKQVRTSGLVLGPSTAGASPFDLGPLGKAQELDNGIPVTHTSPDGKTTTITPNPDGTQTVAQSFTGADGVTTTTTSHNGQPPTTTVASTRPDGSGSVDSTITSPDGKSQRIQKVPTGQGRSVTHAVNPDGSVGAQVSESYPGPNGDGVITDVPGPDGELDREWQRPDGFRAFEQYVVGPDGQQHLAGTANSAGMNSVMSPEGTINTTFPDGRTAQTGQLEDGRVVTEFEDGSILDYDPAKAAPEAANQSPWQVVKSWSGHHISEAWNSGVDTAQAHPYATATGVGASMASEWTVLGGGSMADDAAKMADLSARDSARAFQMLDSGTPGAGRAVVDSMDAASDAASKASAADVLKNTGKYGGWLATAGINSYINWDDWAHNGKPGDEAIANAAGGTAGGIAGSWGGALAGAALCSWAGPPGAAFCAGVGAGIGGLGGGSLGAYSAEQPFK